MTKVLLLVHGMGSHPAGWSDGVRDTLDEVAARYASFKGNGARFSQRAKLVEIRYDGIFEEYVEQWQAKAEELAGYAAAQGRPLPRIVSWLKTTLPDDDAAAKSFFWSTAVDPLLYRGFALVRDRVRAAVMAQVVSALTRNMAGGAVEASVLAHSLGTAVIHDTLHQLGTAPQGGNESFAVGRWQLENVFMVADVCMLGPPWVRDIDYYTSILRPPSAGGGADGSYCQYFVNVWHRWDPFVMCGPFRPTTWGDDYFPVGPLEHFHQANVHGLTHYLDHPAVHVPIINGTLGYRAVPAKEEQDALAKYPVLSAPECATQLQTLKAKAKEFEHVGDDLEELVIDIAEFYAAAKRAGEACKGLASDDPFA